MSESLTISVESKEKAYQTLLPQVESLLHGEKNLIANLANICSAIQMTFSPLWVGFYLVEDDQLVLGPFQGPIACTRINKGKGVCGSAWSENKTIIVKNVEEFPGHIACSSESVSEIVVPLHSANGDIIGVLDIDSIREGQFDNTDKSYLEQLVQILTNTI
jgi:GAF domain-containing protein